MWISAHLERLRLSKSQCSLEDPGLFLESRDLATWKGVYICPVLVIKTIISPPSKASPSPSFQRGAWPSCEHLDFCKLPKPCHTVQVGSGRDHVRSPAQVCFFCSSLFYNYLDLHSHAILNFCGSMPLEDLLSSKSQLC
jgi:hypothetical protein